MDCAPVTVRPSVALVVPTLGQRPEYLSQSLESIRAAGESYVVVVAPASFDASALIAAGLVDSKLDETGRTLAAAINQGFAAVPAETEYLAWLGDDDLLREGALTAAWEFLQTHPRSAMVYGACDYIDENNQIVWENRSGVWAAPLLRFGPDLIPQPGSLFRRSAVLKAGELRTDLGWAFDLEFFLRLARYGRLSYLRRTLAAFRWHSGSLSVGQRESSVREASDVRREYLPRWVRPVSGLWERPVRWATLHGGDWVVKEKK